MIKRILPVCMTVVFLLVFMAPAVFADEVYTIFPYQEYEFHYNSDDYDCAFLNLDTFFVEGVTDDMEFIFRFDGVDYRFGADDFNFVTITNQPVFYLGDCSGLDFMAPGTFPSTGEPYGFIWNAVSGEAVVFANNYTDAVTLDFGIDVVVLSPPASAPGENFLDLVARSIGSVFAWVGISIDALFGSNGLLHDLASLFVIGVSISAIFLGIKVIKHLIWGT